MNIIIKNILTALLFCTSLICLAQKKKELPKHEKEAIQFIFDGNQKMLKGEVLEGEKSYRKAIAKDPNNATAKYNLGYSYYKTENFQEAIQRNKQATELAKTKAEKHIAFHNLGNSYLLNQKAEKAVEAYKNALRNNPTDEETRYNLAVAKEAKKKQDQQNKDQKNNDKNNEEKEDKNKKDDNKEDKEEEDKEEEDKEEEEEEEEEEEDSKSTDKKEDKNTDEKDKENKGDKKDKENDKGDEKNEEKKSPKPVPGKLSPDQVKSLLEAMENQEKEVQDKMNVQKVKGPKIKSDKDW